MTLSNDKSQYLESNKGSPASLQGNHIEENLKDGSEEEITSRSPPTTSSQQRQDPIVNDTVVPPLTILTPTLSPSVSMAAGSSRVSPFFMAPRSLIRRSPPRITEPIAQRCRVHMELETLQRTVEAMDKERVEIIREFNHLHARQGRAEININTLRMELEFSAGRELALRNELEESQLRVARLEERMKSLEENQNTRSNGQ